jgi:hypothetical protein
MNKKVKSHTRKTKDGVSRVKSHSKKSLGKKIATVAGAGVGLAALGLAGKKLSKTVAKRAEIKNFKPKTEGPLLREYETNMLENSRQARVDSIRKEVFSIKKGLKKHSNSAKVAKRKAALKKEVDSSSYTFEPGSVEDASAKLNPNRKTRGAAATILKNTARNLRDRGAYFSKF